jgi:hypothetical protein
MNRQADRPYFKHSIAELESLFAQSKGNPDALSEIHNELKHRETQRAKRLYDKLLDAMGALPLSHKMPVAAISPNRGQSRKTAPAKPPIAIEVPDTDQAHGPSSITQPTQRPVSNNLPESILSAWVALEALSPQTYRKPEDLAAGDRRCVADLTDGELPWERGEKSRPKRQLYYQITLGCMKMNAATKALVEVFGENEEHSNRQNEKAAIAAILVNKDGIPLPENAFAVSSFAWALSMALAGKIGSLGDWSDIERELAEGLERIVGAGSVSANDIQKAFNWLVAKLGLDKSMIEPPSFAIRVYHYWKAKNPPEVSLLNSFFLGDLARCQNLLKKDALPRSLRQYLAIEPTNKRHNLTGNPVVVEAAVAPELIPLGRWPSRGGHPLVLMQQAAVNLARYELKDRAGIFAVNGPPGTGKTTLLRDVVAAAVCDRATAMAEYSSPVDAFEPSGEKVGAGEKAFFHLYKVAESLKGHEVLVASSNNKAVENISRELPGIAAIGRDTDELAYFKSISDTVHNQQVDQEDDEASAHNDPLETWGLIAAVLGNARNRFAFQQRFWWHDEYGFRLYLKAAKGDSVIKEIKDDRGELIERRPPFVVETEQPPMPQMANSNWRKARDRFNALKKEVETDLAAIERIRQRCLQLVEVRKKLAQIDAAIAQLRLQKSGHDGLYNSATRQRDLAAQKQSHAQRVIREHECIRPGFFSRLFRLASWHEWNADHQPLSNAYKAAVRETKEAEIQLAECAKIQATLVAEIDAHITQRDVERTKAKDLSNAISRYREKLDGRLIDDAFFEQGHEASQLTAPWIPDNLHRKREQLFIAAMDVHRAFIDASAQKVLHNLSILMGIFSGGSPADQKMLGLVADLWTTLFMVVPVISTTFASVERMLGDLPPESLGWLLIDEAGQALPQAAVGAIMRAKRSIVVGDPLQIPPVVTLPERLNAGICDFFKIEKSIWAAPEASTQTLADSASRFQGSFRGDQGERRVGVPLLVHRRCQEPMFGISNAIAYDGQMVHAAIPPEGNRIAKILGPSFWHNIDAEAESNWCPAEGELLIDQLSKLGQAGMQKPDIFIISPFRIVAYEIRRRLIVERELFAGMGININEWAADRVGTIHTVQGREADTVFLILGAPKAAQGGARAWASGTPNIFNVAVSRAKQNLYVIGSHGAWSGIGHARAMSLGLNVR